MKPPNELLPLSETLTPADQDAVAEVVRGASQSGTPVYPIGGGTRLDYGARPTRPGLGLSLRGLKRVIDYPAGDLTITVEAGLSIAALAEHLACQRQRLPVDVPEADRATVGGVAATNPSGPRRHRYGTIRDYVLGLRAVDGLGAAFCAGGRVVKNAAGYNLCRLFTGSLGTLGVITQVTLMVTPMPETSAMVACDLADFGIAEKLLGGLVHTETVPTAVELLAGPAWQGDDGLAVESDWAAARLVVGFEGSQAEVDWMVEQLQQEWRSFNPKAKAIRGEACDRAWKRLTEFPAEWRADEAPAAVVQIGVLPSVTVELVRLLRRIDPAGSLQAHAADGVIRARLSCAPGEVASVLGQRLRPAAAQAGGSVVVLSCPEGASLTAADIWGPPPDGIAVMQSLKRKFDPEGILNPGRFVYGNSGFDSSAHRNR